TEITRWRPGTKRSTAASAAEYTGPPRLGALRWRVTRGGVISTHRPMGTPRARRCARAITAMVLRSRLQNHVEGRLRRAPDALEAARPDYLANPCLAGLRGAPHRPPATARSARRPSSNPRN